ncbi:MAG: SDR family oxidoreductase [Pseudomonadota bacterium]
MGNGLSDKVILVTGAARGLGLAYAHCLVRHGARVAMHDGGVDPDGMQPDASVVRTACADFAEAQVLPVTGLLNSRADCAALVETVIRRFGRIDGLIHNAGLVLWAETTEVDDARFRTSSTINHEAAFWLCHAALPVMRRQDYGRIVLTSSGWALGANPGSERLTLYAMSKAAQFGLGMALAHGTGHPDIKVNVVAPVANTRIYVSQVPEGKLMPEAVAGTVAWLVSSACDVNGQLLKVADGDVSVAALSDQGTAHLGERATDPAACGAAIRRLLGAPSQ